LAEHESQNLVGSAAGALLWVDRLSGHDCDASPALPWSSRCRPHGGRADEPRNIENECHRAVAEDGRARDALDVPVVGFQRFDDHLLLSQQVIDEQTDPPPVAFGYDHQALVQCTRARLDAEELVQADDRQVIAAERDDLGMAGEPGDAGRLELHRLHDGEPRHEDELADLGIGQRVVGADEPSGARLGEDACPIEAAAIIAYLHGDVAAAVRGVEVHGPLSGLTRRSAHFRGLDAVIEAVAHEVHQRIADLLQHRLVELGLLAGELELDLLAEALREIAYHAREAAEDEADGQHPYAHDAFLQLAYVAFELSQAA